MPSTRRTARTLPEMSRDEARPSFPLHHRALLSFLVLYLVLP